MTSLEKFLLVSLILAVSVTASWAQGLYRFTQRRVLHAQLLPVDTLLYCSGSAVLHVILVNLVE